MAVFVANFRGMGRMNSARAAAVRRAQEAKQERDARRLAREREVELALADFFEQSTRAAQQRAQAMERAARLIADADAAAAEPDGLAAAAVARLDALGETRAMIAELTGLNPAVIRDVVAAARRERSG